MSQGSSRSIALLSAAAFASVATMRIVDPLLPEIAGEFHVSIGAAAIVATAFTVAYGGFQLIYGLLGERFDKYKMVAFAATVSALTAGAASFADTLTHMAWLRFISGATAAGIIPTAMAYIGDAVPYERRQGVLAGLMSGAMLGVIGGQVTGGLFVEHLGWREAFLALSAAYLAIAALLWWQSRKPGVPRDHRATGPSLYTYLALLRESRPRTVLLAVLVEGFLFYGGFVYFGAFLRGQHGMSYWTIGLVLAAFGIGGLVYAGLSRSLLARLGERGLALFGGALVAASFLAVAWGPVWSMALGIGVAGLGFCGLHTTLQVNATQMAPQARGQAMALFASSLFCGQALGIAVFGHVTDSLGYPLIFSLVGVALLGLGAALSRVLPGRNL
jgi:predicted MFS family arabinose efflux permease